MTSQANNLQTKTQLQSDTIIKYNFHKVEAISRIEIKVKELILTSFFLAIDKRTLFRNIRILVGKELKKIKIDDIEEYQKSIDYWSRFWLDKYYTNSCNLFLLMVKEIDDMGENTNGMTKTMSNKKIFPVVPRIIDFIENKIQSNPNYSLASSKVANYYENFQNITSRFINSGFKEVPQIVNGTFMHGRTLFAKTERLVRFEFHVSELSKMKNENVRLVWIDSHANCSKRCERFQGKLYSLDQSSGTTVEGYHYEPIENAINVYVTTKSGKVWRNGLFGFNCRHRMKKYMPGEKPPATIPKHIIEREREIDYIQRDMERKIFNMRKEAYLLRSASFNLQRAKMLEKQASQMYQQYINFSQSNNRVWYPERCRNGLY